MFHSKLRRPLAVFALVLAVSLLPAPVAAVPRGAGEREVSRISRWIERWERLAWDFLTGLAEKRGSGLNPDGARAQSAPLDDGH
jgi:hypothetical protein